MAKSARNHRPTPVDPQAIGDIAVAGFKSISEEQHIEIRPLTILAGANSSGKSSMMQPLLLLKQTLEAPYDAGPILLNGPNVRFTSAEQLLSRIGKGPSMDGFQVGIRRNAGDAMLLRFRKEHRMGFRIEQMDLTSDREEALTFWPEMTEAEIVKTGFTRERECSNGGRWKIMRERCFLYPVCVRKAPGGSLFPTGQPGLAWESIIPHIIHLPGLRGNPERTYPGAAVGPTYAGTFEKYAASVISQWVREDDTKLKTLNADLKLLQLTGGVTVVRPNDVQIEVQVGRLPDVPPHRPEDRVNVADVGVGVSQTLPVLVALHAATPHHLVYVEQPETHLHPRAQFALARVLAAAANRGVRVVAETHSTMLLLGVQALVAEGTLDSAKVKLHWFERDRRGRTRVGSGELDQAGAFGDWPQDFDDVELGAQKRYLDAAHERLMRAQHG